MIERESRSLLSFALTTSQGTSTPLDFRNMSGGEIAIPNGSSITTLTWWTAPVNETTDGPGTFTLAKDSTGAAVTQTVAGPASYPIPTALFGAAYLQAVVNAAGPVDITLKS